MIPTRPGPSWRLHGGRKRRAGWTVAKPKVWTRLDRTRHSLYVAELGKPDRYRKVPYRRPPPLPCSPPKFEGNKFTGRSDLFELALAIICQCGFDLDYGPDPFQETRAIFEAERQGRSIPFRYFPDEYLVIRENDNRWWAVLIQPENWAYEGDGAVYNFPVENMLTVLPPTFFDEIGHAVKWAATVIRFEAEVTRLWQAEKALPLDASDDARFKHMQKVIRLGTKLGADLALIANDDERAADAIESQRKKVLNKRPLQDELEALIVEQLMLHNVELYKDRLSLNEANFHKLAADWLYQMSHKPDSELGQALKRLNPPDTTNGLKDLMIKTAIKADLIIGP